jgi:hypothetical protein
MADNTAENNETIKTIHPFRNKKGDKSTDNYAHSIYKFDLDDIKFTSDQKNHHVVKDKINKRIPVLKIHELQTQVVYDYMRKAQEIKRGIGAIAAYTDATVEGANEVRLKAMDWVRGLFNQASESDLEAQALRDAAMDVRQEMSANDRMLKEPMRIIRETIRTKLVGYFEIPYDSRTYIDANGSEGWSSQHEEVPEKLKKAIDIVHKNFAIDYPLVPTWSATNPNSFPVINSHMFLINRNINDLINNFKFLHTIAAGPFWTQRMYQYLPPNIYNITAPGFYELFYCSAHLHIENIGMLRQLNTEAMTKFKSGVGNDVTIVNDAFFPDAYKVSMEFKSMIPNNFNVYLNYLVNGTTTYETFNKEANVFSAWGMGNAGGLLKESVLESFNRVIQTANIL